MPVVDNDKECCEIAYELLQETVATIETVCDGKEAVDALAAAEESYYDLVITDIQMPVTNGLEATKAIRNLDRQNA